MPATILPFPARYSRASHRVMGEHLREAFNVPDKPDGELMILTAMADQLLLNLRAYQRPDCRQLMRDG